MHYSVTFVELSLPYVYIFVPYVEVTPALLSNVLKSKARHCIHVSLILNVANATAYSHHCFGSYNSPLLTSLHTSFVLAGRNRH
jgi:hypothetical protein